MTESGQYQPRFVRWTSFLAQLPLQLFFSVWAGGFLGGFLNMLSPAGAAALAAAFGGPYLAIGGAVFVLFPVATLLAKSMNYRNTTYRLRPDRIQIEEGFLTQHRKEILFSSIREISLRRSVLQRLAGLGSIYLATTATGQGPFWRASAILGGTSAFGSGAMLMDLLNAEAVYAELRALADAQDPRLE